MGDPLDTAMRWEESGRYWYPPRLRLDHHPKAPMPDFPGWVTPRFGFGSGGVVHMDYYPLRDPIRFEDLVGPVQLDLFDLMEAS